MVLQMEFVDTKGGVHQRPIEGVEFAYARVRMDTILVLPKNWAEVAAIERCYREGIGNASREFNTPIG